MINNILVRSSRISPLDRTARAVFMIQAGAGFVVTFIFSFVGGLGHAVSASIGALCSIIPNIAFFLVLRLVPASSSDTKELAVENARRFVRFFRMGEFLKLLITIVLFSAILMVHASGLHMLPFFIAFAVTLLAHWGGMLVVPPVEVKHGI